MKSGLSILLEYTAKMAASKSSLELVKKFFNYCLANGGHDKVIEKLKVVSAGAGQCMAELKVGEEHTNAGGTLHGGLTATLVDCVSTYALMADSSSAPGVSVNINVSYMRASRPGNEIIIDAKTIKRGHRLAFLDIIIRDKSSGAVIATGSHTKFIG